MNKPESLCSRCDKFARCLLTYDGENCRNNRSVQPKNYDLVLSKSPDEMADFLEAVFKRFIQPISKCGENCLEDDCAWCWRVWLENYAEI